MNIPELHNILTNLKSQIIATKKVAMYSLKEFKMDDAEMGKIVWETPGVLPVLMFEVMNSVPLIRKNDNFTVESFQRTMLVLRIFKRLMAFRECKKSLLQAGFFDYLTPFVQNLNDNPKYLSMRNVVLEIMFIYVEEDNPTVMQTLIGSRMMDRCVRIIEDEESDPKSTELVCQFLYRCVQSKANRGLVIGFYTKVLRLLKAMYALYKKMNTSNGMEYRRSVASFMLVGVQVHKSRVIIREVIFKDVDMDTDRKKIAENNQDSERLLYLITSFFINVNDMSEVDLSICADDDKK